MNTNNPPNKSRPVRCDDIEVECQKALDAGIPVIWDGMHNCWHPQDGWEPIYLTHFGNTAHNAVQFQPATKTAIFKCRYCKDTGVVELFNSVVPCECRS